MATNTYVQVNTSKVLSFLKQFTKGSSGYVQLAWLPPVTEVGGKEAPRANTFNLDDEAGMRRFIEQNSGVNLYFRPNPLSVAVGSGGGGNATKADVTQAICLHADIDPQPLSKAELETMTPEAKAAHWSSERERRRTQLAAFKPAPSFVVDSGGGYQAFWLLKEAVPAEEAGVFNQRLCAHFKTPDHCWTPDHLMRLPFTTNYPGHVKLAQGRVAAPTQLPVKGGETYDLTDFDFLPMVAPKVATKAKVKVEAKGKGNAEADLPKRFRDLLATDERLQKLWSGNGADLKNPDDRSTRDMSLVSRLVKLGFSDVVITRILRACPNSKAHQDERNDDYINDMISKCRHGRVLSATEPWNNAHRFVSEELTDDSGVPLLRRWNDDYYLWQDGAYQLRTDADIKKLITDYLASARIFVPGKPPKPLVTAAQLAAMTPEAQAVVKASMAAAVPSTSAPFKVNSAKVKNVEEMLSSAVLLTSDVQNPAWIDGATGHDPAELLIMANGILHMPTRELLDHDPRLFSSMALPFAYDPNTKKPEEWLEFLHSLFMDENGVLDEEAIETLQEWFGYCLTTKARHDKILMIIGPKRGGKSTIVRLLRALVGEMNCVGSSLDAMADHFGMESMIGKRLVIFPDARLSGKADMRKLTANVLTASGGDRQSIQRKHKADWLGQLLIKLMLISNELPKMLDDSEALNSRLIFLHLHKSFGEAEQDKGLTEKLLLELPAILTWSLDGLVRLNSRGYFIQPASALELVAEMENLTSPIGAFIRDKCVVDPNAWVYKETLFDAWKGVCLKENRKFEGTCASFGVSLRAAVPKLRAKKVGPKGAQRPAYFGVGLVAGISSVEDLQAKTPEIADLDAVRAKRRAELL